VTIKKIWLNLFFWKPSQNRVLVQGQGECAVQTGGASEANALRGKYYSVFRGFEPIVQQRDWTKRLF
jgi:hypothetical protein